MGWLEKSISKLSGWWLWTKKDIFCMKFMWKCPFLLYCFSISSSNECEMNHNHWLSRWLWLLFFIVWTPLSPKPLVCFKVVRYCKVYSWFKAKSVLHLNRLKFSSPRDTVIYIRSFRWYSQNKHWKVLCFHMVFWKN